MRKTFAAPVAALTVALTLGSLASPAVALSVSSARAAAAPAPSGLQLAQYDRNRNGDRGQGRDRHNRDAFRDRSYWDRRHGNGYYDRTYGRERRDNNSAIAAGFLGFALGAAIAGSAHDREEAANRRNDRAWADSCARRYRSFDAQSGTYLGSDGYRHYCR